ncbi:hypothetical protein G6F35_014134 [Rhizopus arrhizus]|nr:hypothetical protein G6F35_014134 [Rhizopus arrhizus]
MRTASMPRSSSSHATALRSIAVARSNSALVGEARPKSSTPGFVAQALGQAAVPRQYVAAELGFPRDACEVAGQAGACGQVRLDCCNRIVGTDQIVARDQHMGAALRRVVAVRSLIVAYANGVQFKGPLALFDGGMAIGGRQHLHHGQACRREMRDEAVLFFQAGRAAHAVVMALDEHRTLRAVDNGGGRQWPRAVPARLALPVKLRVVLAQPADVPRADRWPVGGDLVGVAALHAGGEIGSASRRGRV